ncbi:MAG: hypothetical protein JOZ97_04690, partial [Candidatus Eremiobacteraeota bacterium]|nr:hypothetical protein [Candidatus Eremiobacteraeota bacterium]
MLNLLVDLRDERYERAAAEAALARIRDAGFTIEEVATGATLATIDQEFDGSWSSE